MANDRPAAEGLAPGHHPPSPVETNHVAPAPRRVRAILGGEVVADTTRALYVWEHPYYPRYYIPLSDVRADALRDDGTTEDTDQGEVALRTVAAGGQERPGAARVVVASDIDGLVDHCRLDWKAMDIWLEEDEQVFVHPRSPYVRVDALRTSRHIRIIKDGALLAEADSAVAVFETGLPTRYYLDKSAVRWEHLQPSDTESECPYKGRTTSYWSVRTPVETYDDLVWCYDFPTRQLLPIAGLVCFYNSEVELTVDGVPG